MAVAVADPVVAGAPMLPTTIDPVASISPNTAITN